MSNSYYENGANHYDHHKELHIDTVNGGDIRKLISAFFKDDAEEAEVVEEIVDIVPDEVKEADDTNDDEELVTNLMPIFYNNKEDVRRFLKEIRGMAQENITDLVNRWVKEKRISDYGNSRKGVLWGILNKVGLYTRSKQNWNGRVV
jgi:hypothetical protein